MKPASLVKNLFLSLAVALCGKESNAQFGGIGSDHMIQTQKVSLQNGSKHERMKAVSLKSDSHATSDEIPLMESGPARSGLLCVIGPENKSSATNLRPDEIEDFQSRFNDQPLHIVGNGYDAIGIEGVLAGLDSLAQHDIDDIILISNLHGGKSIRPVPASATVNPDAFPYKLENQMMYKSDGSSFDAKDYYGAIAERFKTNPKLHNKNLIVIHQSCHGETGLDAFHTLKPGTKVFFYAAADDYAWAKPGTNWFSAAFGKMQYGAYVADKPMPRLSGKAAVATAFMANNLFDENVNRDSANHVSYVEIREGRNDTITVEGVHFSLGTHAGIVVKPEKLRDTVLAHFTDESIQQEMTAYDNFISPDARQHVLNTYRAAKTSQERAAISVHTEDTMNFITVTMALKNPGLLEKSIDAAISHHIVGTNGPKTNGP